MRSLFNVAAAVLGLTSTLSVASPLHQRSSSPSNPFPLSDGFPQPSQQQLNQIEENAFGTLPNATPPATISNQGLTNLRLIAVNELFEVAFFTDLLYNITNNVPGYQIPDSSANSADSTMIDEREILIKTLTAVQAVSPTRF
jgi:hypothetical protein